MKYRLPSVVLAVAVWAQVPAAHASVPPSQFIIKSVVAKHSGVKGVRIRSTVTAVEDGKPSDTHFQLQTWVNYGSGTIQTWSQDDSGQSLYYSQGRISALPAQSAILLGNQVSPVTEALKAAGVPVRTEADLTPLANDDQRVAAELTFMKRFKNTVAWVIGDPAGASVQLWVEKDSFLPLRWIGPQNEVRFDITRFQREFPFPRLISLLHGDTVLFTEEVKEFQINPDFTKERAPTRSDTTGLAPAGESAPTKLKDLLTQYHEFIR